jgi:hypothetical protein
MADEISVIQSPKQMAVGEIIAWVFDFSDIGTPASITSFLAYDETMTDKSSIVLSGSASISGDTVIGKLFTPASAQEYTLQCKVVISGNTVISTLLVEVYNPVATITLSNGYATIKQLKHYLAPGTAQDKYDDEIMAQCIEAASRYIDDITGQQFYATSTTRYFSVPEDRGKELWLEGQYLLTVTTLTNGDATTLSASDYNLLPKNHPPYYAIKIKDGVDKYWEVDSNNDSDYVISIVGTWGYVATTPKDIEVACLELAASLYKRRFGENITANTTVSAGGVVITPQDVTQYTRGVLARYQTVGVI